jgi:hypothetical protein
VQAPHCATAAAVFCSGQPDLLAQHPEQRRLALDVDLLRASVDVELEHAKSPLEVRDGA